MKFTLDNINQAHKTFTGSDFPKLIATFKDMGIVRNIVNIKTGKVSYVHADGREIERLGIRVEKVADSTATEQFKNRLRLHQAGKTDFLTFCNDTAAAGGEKWIVDIEAMTCTYYTSKNEVLFSEAIPH